MPEPLTMRESKSSIVEHMNPFLLLRPPVEGRTMSKSVTTLDADTQACCGADTQACLYVDYMCFVTETQACCSVSADAVMQIQGSGGIQTVISNAIDFATTYSTSQEDGHLVVNGWKIICQNYCYKEGDKFSRKKKGRRQVEHRAPPWTTRADPLHAYHI